MKLVVGIFIVVLLSFGIYVLGFSNSKKNSSTASELQTSYGFDKQQNRVYSLKSISNVEIYLGESQINRDKFSLNATLNFRVIEKKDSKVFTLFQLSNISIKSSNKIINEELKKLYSDIFVVVFSKNGEILDTYFKYKKDDYKGIYQLLSTLQTVLKNSTKYSYMENNYDGVIAVAYSRYKNKINRKRKKYVTINEEFLDYQIKNSNIDVIIDEHWIQALEAKENIVVYEDGAKLMSSKNISSIKEDMKLYDGSIKIWQFDGKIQSLIDEYSNKTKLSYFKKIKQKQQKAYFQEKKVDIEFLLSNIKSYNDYKSLKELEDYITLYPDKVGFLYDYIKNSEDKLSAHLINVLENSGTSQAQELLIKIASSNEFKYISHLRSIVALGGVKEPTHESIEYLLHKYEVRENKIDKELSDTAILSLGVLSTKVDNKQELNQYIKDAYHDSDSISQKRALLLSMQNGDTDKFTDEIYESLEDSNNFIKSAAVKVLSGQNSDEVREKLYELFNETQDRKVRGSVISTLKTIDTDENLMQKARENLFKEQDNLIRKDLIEYLLKYKDSYPTNLETLQEFQPQENDKDNKILLRNAMNSL